MCLEDLPEDRGVLRGRPDRVSVIEPVDQFARQPRVRQSEAHSHSRDHNRRAGLHHIAGNTNFRAGFSGVDATPMRQTGQGLGTVAAPSFEARLRRLAVEPCPHCGSAPAKNA